MQFQYDVFVSYAAVTNNLPNPYGKWVTRLVDDLGKMITNKMGGHPVTIYFDELIPARCWVAPEIPMAM
jgi:hypothetical protein